MAACTSLLAPSCSNCSRNGFCSSFARSSSETTLFSDTGCILSFLASSSEAALFLFLIERMRLSLSLHPQLSVIARVDHDLAVDRPCDLCRGLCPDLRAG